MTDPINPSSPSPFQRANNEQADPINFGGLPSQSNGGGFESFKKFLGPEGYAKFIDLMCQQMRSEIKKQEDKARKALRKWKSDGS